MLNEEKCNISKVLSPEFEPKIKKKKKNRQKQNNIMSPTNLSLKANSLCGERRETATRLITPLEKPLY